MIFLQRIKLILLWLAVGAVLAYFVHSQYQSHVKAKQRQVQLQTETDALVARLRQLALQHGAETDWASKLESKSRVRLSPIMSVELQDVWVRDVPILFVGTLKDIAKNEDGSYQILAQHDSFSSGGHLLFTELFLSARCPAELAIPLLSMAKDAPYTVFANVAIIGKVRSLNSQQVRSSEGDNEVQFTGLSTCLAISQIDRLLPREWNKAPYL